MRISEGGGLVKAGRIVKSNGTEGELLVNFYNIAPDDIAIEEPMFIYCDGLAVPFFIDSIRTKGNDSGKALVRFSDISTLADADELTGQDIYLDLSEYPELAEEDDESFAMLVGWQLSDADNNFIGTVTDFEDIPGNPCLYIDTENGQVMIPLHEELILSVDQENHILVMDIPEGLL